MGGYNGIADGRRCSLRGSPRICRSYRATATCASSTPRKSFPPSKAAPAPKRNRSTTRSLTAPTADSSASRSFPATSVMSRFNYFGSPDQCAETAATVMKFVAHTDAVIFDLRQNHGGDPAMVALLASYLFDRPTHLDDLYNRGENKTTQYWANARQSNRRPAHATGFQFAVAPRA